jgi:tRNA (mo5U34)-methyltransferase
VLDVRELQRRWQGTELQPWAERLPEQVAAGLSVERHGDLPRWSAALARLPEIGDCTANLNASRVTISTGSPLETPTVTALEEALRALHPWRKGPFQLFDLHIDTEWRSDWKWDRLAPFLDPLAGRRVLDVGCGNGYHCWRMRGAGAAEIIGIDPTPLFVAQFQAIQRYVRDPQVCVLPVGVEGLPPKLGAFDTVFSMGVLYHRRSPIRHLQVLRDALRAGGQLVLETLVIEGDAQRCLVPEGRYARMGNVWFIPSSAMILAWLKKMGWRNPRVVDECVTTTEEQRSTDWMTFHSLANFLDPGDSSRTIEGYPAPRRAILLAEAPGRN